ncbi:hypothetical protein [Rhizobium grahamii]|uniref:Uncharacterized protein n=1 Tax=Rhizobium grahamii CCGE 502 TaxID=990285 RepID=S3I3M0_9HYPH|nr:hypothetical protein [Rhizobium grahamii]EPE94248.1 hypothetical protein RGCCGE502_31182 [Rhizobium grahamii CCGE 502]
MKDLYPWHGIQSLRNKSLVRGRLWGKGNSALEDEPRQRLVDELMSAQRAIQDVRNDPANFAQARRRVDEGKNALSERDLVWWPDGEPDLNRHLVKNMPYAAWFEWLQT